MSIYFSVELLETAIAKVTSGAVRPLSPELGLEEDLALTSLQRVDLLIELERQLGRRLDDDGYGRAATVGELVAWLEGREGGEWSGRPARPPDDLSLPRPDWRLSWPVNAFRFAFLEGIFFPLYRLLLDYRTEGAEHLRGLEPPVIFAANHTSHLDVGSVLLAMPRRWRYRLSPIVTTEWFRPFLRPEGQPLAARALRAFQYLGCCVLGDTMLVAPGPCYLRRSLVYFEEQMNRELCPLFFPEGTRTSDGELQRFKPGVGWLATRLGAPVVPVAINGLFEIYAKHDRWPSRGSVQVRLGEPIRCAPGDGYEAVGEVIEQAVRSLVERGARTRSDLLTPTTATGP